MVGAAGGSYCVDPAHVWVAAGEVEGPPWEQRAALALAAAAAPLNAHHRLHSGRATRAGRQPPLARPTTLQFAHPCSAPLHSCRK